jgi:predicted dienelactone hydrolase
MMDSTPTRFAARLVRRFLATAALACALPTLAFNHDTVVNPLPPGHFPVACSNVEQDLSRIAPGASAPDYWEGRPVNGVDHYITEILAHPESAVHYDALVPDQRSIYPGHAGENVAFVAIVCYPTSRLNTDPDYALPGTGDVIPHMALPGAVPQIISDNDYFNPGAQFEARTAHLPLIVFSHGLTGSPISSGYVAALVQLAAQGFIVAAPFHGDPRFSRVRIEDISDVAYLLANFDRVAEMELMRPLSLKVMLDTLLADPGYAAGIDPNRIVGFGASLGGEAMALLLGAKLTTSIGMNCSDPVHDPRIKAAVGYVPFAGYPFLNAFCAGQSGAKGVNRPYLAISGTADTTAPLPQALEAVDQFQSSRYMVELIGGKHELRPEDAGDLFTWTITFLDAYVPNPLDPGAMARFIEMNGVVGGRTDDVILDVHVPLANTGGETEAVEFYNTTLGHYFIAAGPGEIQGILNGAAGPGWEETGQSFKVWLTQPDPSTQAAPVCRFYGVPAGGPNSHFFTASPSECDIVKRNGGWFYEGIGFYIRPVDSSGQCPAGYLQVNRAYNMGFPRNDSNHRFGTSDSTMRVMASKGWVVEGTVMCARP